MLTRVKITAIAQYNTGRDWGGTRPDGRTSVGVGVLLVDIMMSESDLREDFKSVIS